jgi:hypothetical protein
MFLVLHILVKSNYHMTCRVSQAVPMIFIPHQMPNNKKLHNLKKEKRKKNKNLDPKIGLEPPPMLS